MQTDSIAGELFYRNWCGLDEAMIRNILCAAIVVTLLKPAWSEVTTKLPLSQSPCTVFVIGPGTIVSVHRLDLPLTQAHYAVKYMTDDGRVIEVWNPGEDPLLIEGMHGEMTYSIHPERILNFRLVRQKMTDSSKPLHGSQ